MRRTGAMRVLHTLLLASVLQAGCGEPRQASSEPPPVVSPEEQATREVKRYVDAEVGSLAGAVSALCGAAPPPDADGWSIERDREAVEAMRAEWRRARVAYERIEGAIAILFPETDAAVDGRYEREAELRRDETPFDGVGFVGMHAVERILWSGERSEAVQRFERALPGYVEARTPSSEDEARTFRDGLCARLVRDVREMESALAPLALDPATAWRGIVGSIEEQSEKVLLGWTGEDESRYAAHTLADMRANLEGGRAVLAAFGPMIAAHPEAAREREAIEAALARLERAYAEAGADALPAVPEGFDPDAPSEAALRTPYGRLFVLLSTASDPRAEGSLAARLRATGEAMGIPPIAR